ncbi:NAD-dependent epimerase [Gemmatimonadota bacterium]
MKVLVTGAAGFIGFHTSLHLLKSGHSVVGIDNLNEYYDVQLKKERCRILEEQESFTFALLDITDREGVHALFDRYQFDRVIHLAAQAGVRHSLEEPEAYVETNIAGFLNILEGCRRNSLPHLVYASSSSVYGSNTRVPFIETDRVDHPISLYGATKRANELMAHSYSHLFDIPVTGLRFFTVYGPWGRPDMAYFLFTRAILEGEKISLFNQGDMRRDFTYIDDVVEVIGRILDIIPIGMEDDTSEGHPACESSAPFRVYNVGRYETVSLKSFIGLLENEIGKSAIKELLPMQAGDVAATHADVSRLEEAIGYTPQISLPEGIRQFVQWFRDYYQY